MQVLTNEECKNDYSYASSMITGKMLCANVDGGGKDACQVSYPPVGAGCSDYCLTVSGRLRWATDQCHGKQQLPADRSCVMGIWLCPGQCSWCLCQVRTRELNIYNFDRVQSHQSTLLDQRLPLSGWSLLSQQLIFFLEIIQLYWLALSHSLYWLSSPSEVSSE